MTDRAVTKEEMRERFGLMRDRCRRDDGDNWCRSCGPGEMAACEAESDAIRALIESSGEAPAPAPPIKNGPMSVEEALDYWVNEWRDECAAPATLHEKRCEGCTKDRQEACEKALAVLCSALKKREVSRDDVRHLIMSLEPMRSYDSEERDGYLHARTCIAVAWLREVGVTVVSK